MKAIVAVLTVALAVAAVSGVVSGEHFESEPNDINVSYPEDELDRYRPYLDMSRVDRGLTYDLYGRKTTSSDYDLDVYQYWMWYSVQDCQTPGLSHVNDREPVYVWVDPDNESVERVAWDGWHWIKGDTTDPSLYNDSHVQLTVLPCYHAYRMESGDHSGVLLETQNFTDSVLDGWLQNGLEDDLAVGAALDPDSMRSRESWWRDDSGYGVTDTAWFHRSLLNIPFVGSEVGEEVR